MSLELALLEESQTPGLIDEEKDATLKMDCDLDPLLDLLPESYRKALTQDPTTRDTLVDICLDVERVPHAYRGKRDRLVLSPTELLSQAQLDST